MTVISSRGLRAAPLSHPRIAPATAFLRFGGDVSEEGAKLAKAATVIDSPLEEPYQILAEVPAVSERSRGEEAHLRVQNPAFGASFEAW
jgi:hypothetical protein